MKKSKAKQNRNHNANDNEVSIRKPQKLVMQSLCHCGGTQTWWL